MGVGSDEGPDRQRILTVIDSSRCLPNANSRVFIGIESNYLIFRSPISLLKPLSLRESRIMPKNLFAFLLLLGLFFPNAGVAQETQELIGEITQRPDSRHGEWVVAGRKLVANENTDFDSSRDAIVGNLASVEFVVKDSIALITELEGIDLQTSRLWDGPHVLWRNEKDVEILTMVNGNVNRRLLENISGPREISIDHSRVDSIWIDPAPPTPTKSHIEAPPKMLAISDLEGNYSHVLRFLQNNEVLDEDGHWDWGEGHLVLVGDLVDRGAAVTETLWLVKRLEREAELAGGKVHYVLGNHEAMVMAGDLRYVHPKYLFASEQYGVTYDELHGENSEIGRWLRSKNAVVRVGEFLFVHAGYSPTLNKQSIDQDQLNEIVRSRLGKPKLEESTVTTDPVRHRYGPLWYRGYFERYGDRWGGVPSDEQIENILQRHHAKHIVVGHTVVDQVGPLNDAGTLIAIDVKWADSRKCQGLLHEGNRLYRLTMTGDREEILAEVGR